jgi:putative MFS transporter
MPPLLAPNQVAARLDRLPVCRFHYRFLALIALGAWFDYYDNFVAGALALILPRAGVVADTHGSWISGIGLFMAALPLGMFVGTLFFGLATDYLGRRFGFVSMLLIYSLASLAGGAGYYPLTAAAGAGAGLALLLITRFLAGAGIGAENVIIDTYVSEVMPRQSRGRAVALTQTIAFTAVPVAALLAVVLAPEHRPEGWWLLLTLGSLGALFTWYFRRGMPESPRWLAAVGRAADAARVVERIEDAVARDTGQPVPEAAVAPRAEPRRIPFAAIWSPVYRGRTVLLMIFQLLQTVGYYGFMHWLATFLRHKGFSHDQSLQMQFLAFLLAPAGPLLAVWSIERWQRKWLIVMLTLVLACAMIGFSAVDNEGTLIVLASGIVVGLNWFSAVFHAYQAELFPTEARATGIGFTYAWSRVSMVVLNLYMPAIIDASLYAACGIMAAAFFGVAVTIGCFGPLTNARPLETISA